MLNNVLLEKLNVVLKRLLNQLELLPTITKIIQ
jgi:hypothetical protein